MSTPNSDALPPELQSEVDAIRQEEGLDEPAAAEPQTEERVTLSRRQQKEQERQGELRAAREAAEAAKEAAESARRQADEDRAARARLEQQMIELQTIARMSTQPQAQQQRGADDDWRDKYDKQMKKAKDALTAGNLDEYHDRFSRAQSIKVQAEIAPRIPDPRQFQQPAPAPQFQKPAWVQAVENEYPDVVTHDRGFDTVASFVRISGAQPAAINADVLRKAFTRAREELGTAQRQEQQREQKKQIMAGGSSPARGAASGGGKGGTTINLKGFPSGFDYKSAARRAGMSAEDYVRAYAKMNPSDVEKA